MDKHPGSFVVLAEVPAAHRLLQPVVVHLDDGEEPQGLLSHQVLELSVRILGNLGFTSFWEPAFFFFLLCRASSLVAVSLDLSGLTFSGNSTMGTVRSDSYQRWCSRVFRASSLITSSTSRNFSSFLWKIRSLMAAIDPMLDIRKRGM